MLKRFLSEDFNARNPQPSHFTQVVWKGSRQVGCAQINCPPGSIFDAKFGVTPYHICEYFPQGNVIGHFGYALTHRLKFSSANGLFIAVRMCSELAHDDYDGSIIHYCICMLYNFLHYTLTVLYNYFQCRRCFVAELVCHIIRALVIRVVSSN
jgi:hypothetical protein